MKIKYIIFFLLLAVPISSASTVDRMQDRNVIFFFTDGSYSDSINVNVNVTLTGNDSFQLARFIETIPDIFNVTLFADNTDIVKQNSDYIFTGWDSIVNYSITVNTSSKITCATPYNITGTFINDNLQTGIVTPNNTTLYVIPVTQYTIDYVPWDINFNNKIDRTEVIASLVYWMSNPTYSKISLFKVIGKYFDQTNIIPSCYT